MEFPQETEDLQAQQDETLSEPVSSLSVELTRISAEIQSINSDFQEQLQQAIAEAQATMEERYAARLQAAVAEVRQKLVREIRLEIRRDFEDELDRNIIQAKAVCREIERVGRQLEELSAEIIKMVDDDSAPLAVIMRKNAEKAALSAYLQGLRFLDV